MTGRVDAHHHLWDLSVRDQDWITGPDMAPIRRDFAVADLTPVARAAGVDTTVVVQTVTVPEETPELLALADSESLIGAVVGWVDLTADDIADRLAALAAGPGGQWLRGIRHQVQGEPNPQWLCRADVRRGLRAIADAGLVYELLTLPHQLPAAIETVQALPDLDFVLDHCSKPLIADGEIDSWAADVRALAAASGRVSCKLSGLVTEAGPDWSVSRLQPYVDVVLSAFGVDRVLFGSDWPVCLLAASYGEVVGTAESLCSGLSSSERDAVFGANARRVYGLS